MIPMSGLEFMTDIPYDRQMGLPVGLRLRLVDQMLLHQNEYLAAGNHILRTHLSARIRLSDPQRIAPPDTILAW